MSVAFGSRRVQTKPAGLCKTSVSVFRRPNESVPDLYVVGRFHLGGEIGARLRR